MHFYRLHAIFYIVCLQIFIITVLIRKNVFFMNIWVTVRKNIINRKRKENNKSCSIRLLEIEQEFPKCLCFSHSTKTHSEVLFGNFLKNMGTFWCFLIFSTTIAKIEKVLWTKYVYSQILHILSLLNENQWTNIFFC